MKSLKMKHATITGCSRLVQWWFNVFSSSSSFSSSSFVISSSSVSSFTTFVLLILSILATNVVGDKLNERRILLPYNSGVPTNFTLEALSTSSCYKWTSSRPDIASVKPLDDPTCSRRAVVTVVSRMPKRQNSVILAYDIKTNQQIRCDVEIDVISRIEIVTTTREIVYGELPETIKAVAYNEKNDIFTSIGGVQFDWTIGPMDIIRYRPWASSSYAAPDFVEYWESKGAKSSYVLMEGVRTGSAKIKARAMGDAYQDVPPSEITVHVVANLLLIPSNDLFLVRGAKVGFRAEIAKQGPRMPLNLPMPQYYLAVLDPEIAAFDEQNNQLEATEEGHTSLVLRDRNVEGEGLSQTSTDIHVMAPSYISLQITPGEKFALRNNTVYTVTLSLHDDWHHKLYPSDNLNLVVHFPPEYFTVLEQTSNGTYYVIQTHKIGACKLTAQFLGAGSVLLDVPLEHVQDVHIYPPITLSPSRIFLPLIESQHQLQSYTVKVRATGATGEYNWQSSNESSTQVKSSEQDTSIATVYTKGDEGEIQITCNDVHNSLIFNAHMTIYIRPIEAIEILPSIVESHVGGNIILPIAVLGYLDGKGGSKVYFDSCDHISFEVEIVEKNRIRYRPEEIIGGLGAHSCRSLSFECLAAGNSKVRINYASEDKNKSTLATVGCFMPLTLVHPNKFAVLSLGAIIDVAFVGGPRPWAMYPEGHYTKAETINSTVIALKELKDPHRRNRDMHIFRVKCIGYGETSIELNVGNVKSPTLVNPASTMASVKIICAKPETLIVRPRMKESCPQQDFVFTLEKNRDIELDVQVFDVAGNSFYNFSTFYFEWAKEGNGEFRDPQHGILEVVNGANGYFSLTRSYQVLKHFTTLRSKIRARITGYQGTFFGDRFDIRREIELVLMDPLVTDENNVSILKHEEYKKSIKIKQGSGYFSIDLQQGYRKDIINVDFKTNERLFNITPRAIGSGVLIISDLCLDYPQYQLHYSVVEPLDVKIELIDKIELGRTVSGSFYVLDNRGSRLKSHLHSTLDFAIIASNSFITISDVKPKDDTTSSFTLKAERLGLAKIVIQSQSTKVKPIQSVPIEVQIFSPLQITPSNITLIVGNHFQVTVIGGPQTQRNILFAIEDIVDTRNAQKPIIASVGSNGLIKAHLIGRTKLTAKVLNVNNFEYSRAEVEVNVVPLTKIKIWTPINQILVGSHIPLHLIGASEQHETPFMFGQADPALQIKWWVTNTKLASVQSSFEPYGFGDGTGVNSGGQISALLQAHSLGTVMVRVEVKVSKSSTNRDTEQILHNTVLTDTVQVAVYSNFAPILATALSSEELHHHHQPKTAAFSTPKVLLLSPQADLVLRFNHLDSIDFKMINATQVRVINSTELHVQAGDQIEQALLLLSRDLHRTGLIEFYSYAIHVDKVRYLSLEVDTSHRAVTPNPVDAFPLGSETRLVVRYFDNHGRRFDSVKSNLKWYLSRNDIITISSGTLYSDSALLIRALKEGTVVIYVYDEVNNVGSYYKLAVGTIIEPRVQPIIMQVGDIVCLRSKLHSPPVLSKAIEYGELDQESEVLDHTYHELPWWSIKSGTDSTSHSDLLDVKYPIGHISAVHGTLVALRAGHGTILYNSTAAGVHTYSQIEILRLKHLKLDLTSITGLTTTFPLRIPLILERSEDTTFHTPTMGTKLCATPAQVRSTLAYLASNRQLPFSCSLTVEDTPIAPLWHTHMEYNVERAQWYCVLTPNSGIDSDNLALFNFNVTVTAMANLALATEEDILDPTLFPYDQETFPFYPPFQLGTKQIILTSDAKEVRFTIHSVPAVLHELQLKPSNDDILDVRKLDLIENANSLKVAVLLRNADIFSNDVSNLHLLIVSTLTNQTEKLPVQIKLYGTLAQLPSQILSPTTFYYNLILIIITIVLAFVLWILAKRVVFDPTGIGRFSDFPSMDSFANQSFSSTPKTPRVIDYQSSPTTKLTAQITPISNQSMLNRSSFGTDSGGGSGNSGGNTPSRSLSPLSTSKVGRPLYSTRQYFQ